MKLPSHGFKRKKQNRHRLIFVSYKFGSNSQVLLLKIILLNFDIVRKELEILDGGGVLLRKGYKDEDSCCPAKTKMAQVGSEKAPGLPRILTDIPQRLVRAPSYLALAMTSAWYSR